jgi:nitrogen fixation-related uncharacterized protein
MERLVFIQFLVALCMSLAGVCFFVWGTLAGLFKDIESIKYDMLRRELDSATGGTHGRH